MDLFNGRISILATYVKYKTSSQADRTHKGNELWSVIYIGWLRRNKYMLRLPSTFVKVQLDIVTSKYVIRRR